MNDPIKTTVPIRGINIFVPLRVDALPRDQIPLEGPVGDLEWDVVLEGSGLHMLARLNGSNYRRMLKTIEDNNRNVSVVLRGKLRITPGDSPLVLESAGFDVKIKKTRPGSATAFNSANTSARSPSMQSPSMAPSSSASANPSTKDLPGAALPGRRIFVPTPKHSPSTRRG